MSPLWITFAFALAILVVRTSNGFAEEAVFENCKVVRVEDRKLYLEKEGQQHFLEVAADAKITMDGKTVKLADLKSGTTVKITARKADGTVTVIKLEATSK